MRFNRKNKIKKVNSSCVANVWCSCTINYLRETKTIQLQVDLLKSKPNKKISFKNKLFSLP